MATQTLATYYNLITLGVIKEGSMIVNSLREKNPMVFDAVVRASNEKMGHTGTRVLSLPSATIRKVSAFITPTTARLGPYHDDISIFSEASSVPDDVRRIEGAAKVQMLDDLAEEGFMQSVANHWINGDSATTPEKFDGFAKRYNTPDNDGGSNSPEDPDTSTAAQVNVYDAKGTGSDLMSIWFMKWGREQVDVITPFGDPQFGMTFRDFGQIHEQDMTSSTNDGASRLVWRKQWEWWHGLSIGNQQCVARIRNIESSIDAVDTGLKKLIFRVLNEGMIQGTGTIWMYIPLRMKTHFDILLESKQNVIFSRDNPYNVSMPMWGGTVPIRPSQALTTTESRVAPV